VAGYRSGPLSICLEKVGQHCHILWQFLLIILSGMHELAIIVADINELSLPKTCQIDFPDPNDLLTFKLSICPDEVIQLHKPTLLVFHLHCTCNIYNNDINVH